jgi:DNA repair protein RecO (recombination protein O)
MFCYVDIAKISKLDISDQVKREINNFLDEYYDQYTGLYLKSKTFLKNLNKIS